MSYYVSFCSCVFPVFLVLRLPRLGKRELILVLFVRLFDLCLFGFVGFLFLLVSGKGCGLWLWHSLDFSLTLFFLKIHDFIHVNNSVAGEYNKHKQDGSHLRFSFRMILATVEIFKMDAYRNVLRYFFLSTPMLLTTFRANWPFSSEEKGKKIDFQDDPHLGFPIGTILAIFISTSHLDASYQF